MRCPTCWPPSVPPQHRRGGVERRELASVRHGTLTLIATFAGSHGQVINCLGPSRTEGPVRTTRLDETARGAGRGSQIKQTSADLGRAFVGQGRSCVVHDAKERPPMFTCGTVRTVKPVARMLFPLQLVLSASPYAFSPRQTSV